MAESLEDLPVETNPADLCGSLDTTPFFSFTRDLEHLEGVNADGADTGNGQDEIELFGGIQDR